MHALYMNEQMTLEIRKYEWLIKYALWIVWRVLVLEHELVNGFTERVNPHVKNAD